MANLMTNYLGLKLKNPVIVGSCGLTNSLKHLKEMEDAGAGAVVLKSIFEEQIMLNAEEFLKSSNPNASLFKQSFQDSVKERYQDYDLAFDYIQDYAKQTSLENYLNFVRAAKSALKIPVIASINCISGYDWEFFAKRIQESGADAIELNVFLLPSDLSHTPEYLEDTYIKIATEVKKFVTIPVALKIGYFFTNLIRTIQHISDTGVEGLVLFNRPYNPDIDINTLQFVTKNIHSSPNEYANTLRWMGILSGRVPCDLSASTGNHTAESVIKQILVGAASVQLVSAVYEKGIPYITQIINELSTWMDKHGFLEIKDFKGLMSQNKVHNPAAFERVQFMRHYAGIE